MTVILEDALAKNGIKRLFTNAEQRKILRKMLIARERELNNKQRLTGLFLTRRNQALLEINDLLRSLGEG